MDRFKWSLIGLAVSAAIFIPDVVLNLNLFEKYTAFLASGDPYYLDELALVVSLFLFFFMFDAFQRVRKDKIETEKLKIFKAMMLSHNHIINNFLNQALLLRFAAEETPGFDPHALQAYDQCAKEAQNLIKELGSITEISETSILESIAPKAPETPIKFNWDRQRRKLVPAPPDEK